MNRPIGVFDSGVGGLTALSSLQLLLPKEDFIYIGDNKNSPYGEKTKEELLSYAIRIVEYFIQRDVKMVLFACNTTTATVLEVIKKRYPDMLFLGVIDSTVHSFLEKNLASTLIIATTTTIQSGAYEKLIKEKEPLVDIYSLATPALVPLIENGTYRQGITSILQEYLQPYEDVVDSIILGCTHYPIISHQIEEIYPSKVLISSSDSMGYQVKEILKNKKIMSTNKIGSIEIYTTGDCAAFMYSSSSFYQYENIVVKHLNL